VLAASRKTKGGDRSSSIQFSPKLLADLKLKSLLTLLRSIAEQQTSLLSYFKCHIYLLKMAEAGPSGGIDKKADERMEFSTSKEVTVHPTFEAMSLKGTDTRHCLCRCFDGSNGQ
jgi:hypothetical protein